MSIDRKAAIRQYKETPRTMGVGVVRNTVTGKSSLISGIDLPSLLNRHQAQLRLNAHMVKALQADWNAQKGESFVFEVVDTLEPRRSRLRSARGLGGIGAALAREARRLRTGGYNRRRKSS
jgi:ribosome biogenesis GTPase A